MDGVDTCKDSPVIRGRGEVLSWETHPVLSPRLCWGRGDRRTGMLALLPASYLQGQACLPPCLQHPFPLLPSLLPSATGLRRIPAQPSAIVTVVLLSPVPLCRPFMFLKCHGQSHDIGPPGCWNFPGSAVNRPVPMAHGRLLAVRREERRLPLLQPSLGASGFPLLLAVR